MHFTNPDGQISNDVLSITIAGLCLGIAYLFHSLSEQKKLNVELVKFIVTASGALEYLKEHLDAIEKKEEVKK
jgi:hypothetical protein